jgi:hypothetical protein
MRKFVGECKTNKEERNNYLHVLWMVANAINHLLWLNFANANSVDGCEKWEFVFHALGLQHVVDFSRGDWSLKQN